MYPGFAKTARDEGFDEIAEWLETLARAEKSHAGRFSEGLESVDVTVSRGAGGVTRRLRLEDIGISGPTSAAERRTAAQIIELKGRRRVAVGPIVTLVFESREPSDSRSRRWSASSGC